MKLVFSKQIFEKRININFHESPSIGLRSVPCGQTEGQKLRSLVAFCDIANASKKKKHGNCCRFAYSYLLGSDSTSEDFPRFTKNLTSKVATVFHPDSSTFSASL